MIATRHARLPYGSAAHWEPRPDAAMLAVSNLAVRYPGSPEPALSGVSLSVDAGQRVALVGGNGSGKSTLLRAIVGIVPVAEGSVQVRGHGLDCCHHRVAYLPQHGEIDWSFPMDVARLVLTGRYSRLGWFARPRDSDRDAAAAALSAVGLDALSRRRIAALSGGQRQRVLLARALAADAELLLLDEPHAALDTEARATVDALLDRLHESGVTMLIATHDAEDRRWDAEIHLVDGHRVDRGTP